MSVRLLRALVTFAAFVAAWFVVTPASAAIAASTTSSPVSAASLAPAASEKPASASFAPPSSPPAPLPAPIGPITKAPLCDPRGAITFAPPPQMQDTEVSLDTGLGPDDCMASSRDAHAAAAGHGRAPLPTGAHAASLDAALVTAVAALAHAARELVPVPVAGTSCPRPGIRSTVDRPPRV